VLTLLIGVGAGILVGLLCGLTFAGGLWRTVLGLAAFFAVTIPINLAVKRRLEALFKGVQTMIEQQQGTMRRKVNLMAGKMMSSTKGLQRQIEKQQEETVVQALRALDGVSRLRRWSPLAERQANTLRAQLCFQIQDYEKADEYFAKSFALDPVTVAMKLVRLYQRGKRDEYDKLYRRSVKRFRGDKPVLLYALHSWVLVEEGKIDEAVAVLVEAKDRTENETLRSNWEHLVNGRTRSFSNAGLGDLWYALHLETPKPVKVRQPRFGGRMR